MSDLAEGIGHSNSGSDHPNPTQPQSHPAVTPSTDLLPRGMASIVTTG